MSNRPAMSRAVRTGRGAFGALSATLFAAVSHSIGGGTATPIAIVTTAILALPLCVLLAGRTGSLWRLTLGVAVAQAMYHWTFAGMGAAQSVGLPAASGGLAPNPHLGHQGLITFVPALAQAGSADASMWVSHALAALLTIALMYRGERAAMHLVRVVRSTLPVHLPRAVRLPGRGPILAPYTAPARAHTPRFFTAISHRGPPARAFA